MNPASTNRLIEALGGLEPGEPATQLQAHPGVAVFFSLLFVAGLAAGALALVWMARSRPRFDLLLRRPWTGIDLIRLLALLLGLLGVFWTGLGLVRTFRPDIEKSVAFEAATAAAQTLVFHWPVLIFAVVVSVRRRMGLRSAFGMDGRRVLRDAGIGVFFYVAAMPAVAVSALVVRWILQRTGVDTAPQPVLDLMIGGEAGWLRVYLIGLGVVLAPIAEEILFRGLALPVLARHIGTAGALVATAALFAAVHMNAAASAPLFVLGLVFGLAYLYTGSLTPAIVLHSVFNAVSITVSHLIA